MYHGLQKNNKQHNIEQNKKWFLKDHVTLKTREMASDNSAWQHRNK